MGSQLTMVRHSVLFTYRISLETRSRYNLNWWAMCPGQANPPWIDDPNVISSE